MKGIYLAEISEEGLLLVRTKIFGYCLEGSLKIKNLIIIACSEN